MFCCPNCFDDPWLGWKIRTSKVQVGYCNYCGSEGQPLVSPRSLSEYFQMVADCWVEDPSGRGLGEIFREDWGMFVRLSPTNLTMLLAELLGAGVEGKKFVADPSLPSKVARWEDFREELKFKNRFFPDLVPEFASLRLIFPQLLSGCPSGTHLYRARIEEEGKFRPSEMGRPPRDKTRSGRANPIGIPYLYLAMSPETAIAEVRPHPGDRVTIGHFVLTQDLDLLDFRELRSRVSPFNQLDTLKASQLLDDILFLRRLEQDLSKPFQPRKAELEYLPTQYLCEFLKKEGYRGILYASSVGPTGGANVALFDDLAVACRRTTTRYTEAVDVRTVQV